VRTVKSNRAVLCRTVGALALLAGWILTPKDAAAEVTLVKSDPWEVYTAGRVNVFFGYAFGDAKPTGPGTLKGGGVDSSSDKIPDLLPDGTANNATAGKLSKMRFHSGFVPNVFSLGVRRKMGGNTTLRAQMSIWGTVETQAQRKFVPVITDFREGFLEADGPWGTFTAGRFGSLFSRGVTETDFLYLHGYGVGFWGGGGTYNPGPTAGLIGFGVLANSFSPGIMYTTPNVGGLRVALGLFDPVSIAGSWDGTRTPRPEAEAMYDLASGTFKLHLYVNGAIQKVYDPGQTKDNTVKGVGGGFRAEVGNFHIGAGGHYGQGLGLYYALEGSDADVSGAQNPKGREFRTAQGYSVMAQYVLGSVDLDAGFGQSIVKLLPFDKTPEGSMDRPIKAQTGIAAAVVYHLNESFHLDLDYLRAMFRWYGGAKEDVNYLNAGVTLTW
jgi:hypothetical protein